MIPRRRHLCKCGCKKSVKPGNEYINGHNGRKPPKIYQYHPCECGCGELVKEGKRFKSGHNSKLHLILPWNKGLTKETDPRIALQATKMKGKPSWIKGQTKETNPILAKISEKNKIKNKMLWQDSEYRKNQVEKHKAYWDDNKRKIMSDSKLESWQDPEYIRKQMKARSVKQNKAELKLEQILNELCPNEYKFVGDGQVIIAGKCPDFINVNGQKKIIELFGDYFHAGDNPADRAEIFKPFGYDTLVIWEHELKDINSTKEIIKEFNDKYQQGE